MPVNPIIYLDNSATTQVCEEAAQKALEAMRIHYGNPSSLHSMGVAAELMLKDARSNIAVALGVEPAEITFTSGGTEANNMAIIGGARALKRRGNRVVISAIEHPSVENAAAELEKEGFEVIRLKPGNNGSIFEQAVYDAVSKETVLVSIMLVNNETGTVQPVSAARKAVQRAGSPALIHCDAVQAFCKIPVKPQKLGADLVTVSSHKIHGPKGAGALYIKRGARILPVVFGGGQEKGLRSGTEAVPSIVGFGEAARIAYEKLDETSALCRSLFNHCAEALAKIPGVIINTPLESAEAITGGIINFSVPGIKSETMLHFLEARGIFVSSGSACSKGKHSSVLEALGLDAALIDSAVRVSFSRYNTIEDVNALCEAVSMGSVSLARKR